MRELADEGEPVNQVTVGRRAKSVDANYIRQLLFGTLPISCAESEAEILWIEYRARQTHKILQEAAGEIQKSPDQTETIVATTCLALETIKLANFAKGSFSEIVDAADFLQESLPEPHETIAGILHQGSKLVLGGGSKSHKTWALLDLAVSVSQGRNWMLFPTTKGKVLYVNFEIQATQWQKRIRFVAQAKGIELHPGAIHLLNLRGHAADYHQLIPKIIRAARKASYALIILDPIYKIYGDTDENSAGGVAALLNEIERLAVETGAAVAFGAHFAKGNASGKETIDRISGSGVYARDPDTLIMLTPHETEDAFTVETILRNFAPVKPFAVRWEFPLLCPADDLDPAKLKRAKCGKKPKFEPEKLLTAIFDATKEKPVSVSAWAIRANACRQTLQEYLPKLRANCLIETVGEGNRARQFLTGKGRSIAMKVMETNLPDIESGTQQLNPAG